MLGLRLREMNQEFRLARHDDRSRGRIPNGTYSATADTLRDVETRKGGAYRRHVVAEARAEIDDLAIRRDLQYSASVGSIGSNGRTNSSRGASRRWRLSCRAPPRNWSHGADRIGVVGFADEQDADFVRDAVREVPVIKAATLERSSACNPSGTVATSSEARVMRPRLPRPRPSPMTSKSGAPEVGGVSPPARTRRLDPPPYLNPHP